MVRTNAGLSRWALAAGLSVAAGAAHAVPIVFDFTGTVWQTTHHDFVNGQSITDESLAGQSVVGRITVETDGLVPRTITRSWGTYFLHSDQRSGSSDLITSELTIGGIPYDVDLYPDSLSDVAAFDSGGARCEGCAIDPDWISVADTSREYFSPDTPGEFLGRSLGLMWSGSDTTDPLGMVDSSVGFEPLDLISVLAGILPSYGSYEVETWSCADGDCSNTALSSTTFTFNSLTIHTPSVPEPGTLALFGVGLLGSAFARRSAIKGR